MGTNKNKMKTLKLDDITEVQSIVIFNTSKLLEMFESVFKYSHSDILYNDFQKKLDKLGFRFCSTKGRGVCKIIVTDRNNPNIKFLFIY